ncbi:MAG TPA: VWA domain-containing protein [Terracidiphilus sp.]|nr:VWA domain-containing protein [Terracidiphilus sp.]
MPALRCARRVSEPDHPRQPGDTNQSHPEPLPIATTILRSLLPALLGVLCLLPAAGQNESSLSQTSVPVQFATPPEGLIHLDVAVTDQAGRSVLELSRKDFTLLDNGQPQKIISFRSSQNASDPNAHLAEIVFVIDQVNLPPEQIAFVRHDLAMFLGQNSGRLPVPVSIYWFRRSGLYATAPSTNGIALAAEVVHDRAQRELWDTPAPRAGDLGALGALSGKLWDSALRTIYTIAIERRELPGRKALVWFGPGWPLDTGHFRQSRDALDALIELSTRIREARLDLCQVAIPVPEGSRSAQPVLSFDDSDSLVGVHSLAELGNDPRSINARFALPLLAIQSGGLVVDQTIARSIESCIHDASFFYTLSFDPPKASAPDEYHALTVKVRGLTARTSTGYYDEPLFYDQPRVPTTRITVQELSQLLDAAAKEHDSELADQLTGLELTERLSSPGLARLMASLGAKSRAALTALADESAFLDPPAADILADPAPDPAAQQEILSRTRAYLQSVLPKLPDFYAARTAVRYQQPTPRQDDTWKAALSDQSLRVAVTVKATLRYRKGREEQDVEKQKGSRAAKRRDLNLVGVFGPLLDVAFADATSPPGTLTWTRWERGVAGKIAVFHYQVPGPNSVFSSLTCCLKEHRIFRATPSDHGEIAVDPQTGAILRFTIDSEPGWIIESNLHPVRPVLETHTMTEYGPVEIGGRSYICPLRSVLIMRTRPVRQVNFWDESFEIYSSYETMLDDFSYTGYHKFGSESRILPGFQPVPNSNP